jgi:hypothetical protein
LAVTIPTVITEGAVPDVADTLSQFAELKVLLVSVQLKVPAPALRICSTWGGGCPPGSIEKLTCPGVLSKKVALAGEITRVTATVRVVTPPALKTTCPV